MTQGSAAHPTGTAPRRRDPRYDLLFEPIRIGPKVMKNRFYQVPQCTGAGHPRPGSNAGHRAVKAEGGWGGLSTESCSIHPEVNQTGSTNTTMWDEGDVINHRHMVDEVHKWGALAGVELGAGGVKDNLWSRYVAPAFDRFPSGGTPKVYTYAATEEDIARVMQMYEDAARRAKDAGFDILYIHGAAGVFPVHALSRHFNRRTDGYGGSFENRARFWVEALERLKKVAGDDCAVATRISIDDLAGPWGLELHDEGLAFVDYITKLGLVDMWDVIIGGSGEDMWGEDSGPSRFYKSNHQSPWNAEVKRIAKVPVVGVGRFTEPDEMVRVIRSGQLDIIGAARPSIADPWLPRKIDEGRVEDICECIGCNACVSRFNLNNMIICTQNPTALEEYRRGWHPERFEPAPNPEMVLVVGAGPSGLECARVLGKRGYEVHLVEAKEQLGGHLRDVVRLPGLAEWGRVYDYRESQIAGMSNITVMRGTGLVTAEDILNYGARRVVLATGARWVGNGLGASGPDTVPGIDAALDHFVTPEQYFAGKAIGGRVVVLDSDGYFMGISIAETLADQGKEVTLVTHLETVAPMTALTLEGYNLRRMMREKGIKERTGHWVDKVEKDAAGVKVALYDRYRDGSRRTTTPQNGVYPRRLGDAVEILDCDSVILCTAREAKTALHDDLIAFKPRWQESGLEVVARSGDCLAPRYLADAIFDGHRIAREFESVNPERPKAIIRERQIWGHETFPKLGDHVV
ncbi:FAD-dependent oxidoreductase [Nordella sp. HKS 07]|uniref:oxidoreductase n=1 Tax=Nordella sp. HKS 07 TaxID=2712222 RepID=UPI0013E1A8C7|nr:FAD-dependent oxidoreductase [Nordella sp. HKS 07]QIG47403.1 FAD-dependent oxidoreductase [Nordella sp. HKS 07]